VSLFIFILALMAMIVIHELGHLLAAKWMGMDVPKFSLFFGRPLAKKHWRGTDYQIGWIPAGGFVKITGMTREEEVPEDMQGKRYCDSPAWRKIVVIAAGPLANLALAFLLLFIFYVAAVPQFKVDTLVSSTSDTAQALGIAAGDRVVAAGDMRSEDAEKIIGAIRERDGKPLELTVSRDGSRRTVTIPAGGDGPIGILFTREQVGTTSLGIPGAMRASAEELWWQTRVTAVALSQVVTDSQARGELSTIVGIGALSDEADAAGMTLRFLAAISFMLFFFNLLPILPLDGGHILFAIIEGIRRKPLSMRAYNAAAIAGLAVLLLGFVVGINNDIGRLT